MGYIRTRRGFVILWVIVTIAIVAVLAATTAPFVAEYADQRRVEETADILARLSTAVDDFNLLVKRGGSSFTTPATLSLLTSPVVNAQRAGCSSQTYNGTAVTNWNANGPFGPFLITAAGVMTPIGTINNTPSRTPNTVGTQRTSTNDPYYVQMQNVRVQLARMLDSYVDNAVSQAAGAVQYTAPVGADSLVTLSYNTTLAHTPAC